ncbi:MAG: TPM domain-containing protein [Clostridiales bacterium]|nr:TPM domain-containing protein [Clostridiales bacterium]
MNKRIIAIICTLIMILPMSALCAFANENSLASAEDAEIVSALENHPNRVIDNAGLLDDGEEILLKEKLDEISGHHKIDVVVVTTNTLEGKSAEAYADDYFDYKGYGLGGDRSGVLLLISMEDRDWWISTRGYGITAFTDYGIQEIGEEIKPYLSDGDYFDAFVRYAELCDDFIIQAVTGNAYDINNPPETAKRGPSAKTIVIAVLACLGGGFLFAGIPVGIMKGKLKSVRMNPDAKNYVRDGSFVLTNQRDMFLYRTVTRTAKPKNSSSGGSSTHHSSSGASHGGGGGKF